VLLSSEEQAVVAAIVTADIDPYRGERPILLLDETSTWMPLAEDEPSVPDDFPRGDWLAQNPPVPDALRVANARMFAVGPGGVAAGVTAFPRSRFEQMHRSRRGLRGLSKSFGRREPAVLEVSRPVINDQGEALVLVHMFNTASGCGSISMYSAHRQGGQWLGELKRVLVIW
jgi:hypothetical protein